MDNLNINVQGQQLGIMGEEIANLTGMASGEAATRSNLGDMVRAIQSGLKNAMPSGGDVSSAIGDIGRHFTGRDQTGALSNVDKQLAFILRRTLDRFGASRGVDTGMGSIVNPKAALGFEGVTLKHHSFNWELAVKTRGE
ncbi:MAG: hypothetical protein WCY93_10525, partial [Anaerolineaceae bacterium]